MAFLANIDTSAVLICVTAFLLLFWWLYSLKDLPPGPWGWPLLGYLPNLVISVYRTGLGPAQLLSILAKRYGPVFSIKIGWKLVVFLNTFKYVKEGFNNPRLNDKLVPHIRKELGIDGGFMSSGNSWKEQRRFALKTLRSFGVGKRSFEANISEEVKCLANEISSLEGKAFDPGHFTNNAAANVICSVVFGKRFEYSDPSFKRLMVLLRGNTKNFGLYQAFSFGKYLQPSAYSAVKGTLNSSLQFIKDIVNDHKNVHVENEPNDFIDVYLDEMKKNKKLNHDSFLNDSNLIATVRAFFSAGTDTVASTLRWAILYMMAFPKIQDRIHQELDSVVGRNRLPRLADEKDLPYTCATLLEAHRMGSVVSFGVQHVCGEDTTLGPYAIPKGTVVVTNLMAIHYNPELWPNPDEFNPERFLDEDGVLQTKEELIPFRQVFACVPENILPRWSFTSSSLTCFTSLQSRNQLIRHLFH
ncbi:cytochrome P450 2J4-like [Amphiura filiformis]|uniref:cytochrome P450 2J4-like n=1 Tax=Amphiura filiformis TaxID=82378 RepID=UPI003B20D19D